MNSTPPHTHRTTHLGSLLSHTHTHLVYRNYGDQIFFAIICKTSGARDIIDESTPRWQGHADCDG
jgi:diadenosine tetraphosphate (Ap4A) HIT family hydrolase